MAIEKLLCPRMDVLVQLKRGRWVLSLVDHPQRNAVAEEEREEDKEAV